MKGDRRKALGFAAGAIKLIKGDYAFYEEWLRKSTARFHNQFKWFFTSEDTIPEDLPKGLEVIELPPEKVFVGDTDELLPQSKIQEEIDALLYGDSVSTHFGKISARYDLVLTLVCETITSSTYGDKRFYLFVDKDGNEFTWSTATNKELERNKTYECRGTIKAHNIYKGKKQTELSRVMNFKEVIR